ncbi:MAG: macro domain-containing protein [Stenotrophomonas sp.]
MPVSFETGDIFATPGLSSYAHGCNCAGAMGKGIAVAFRQHWPAMYEAYRRLCMAGEFAPGDVFVWEEGAVTVFNLGTQLSWRTKAEYGAVERALSEMLREAEVRGVPEIALPSIGAGLGGLEWPRVRVLLEAFGAATPIRLRVCETFVEGVPLAA